MKRPRGFTLLEVLVAVAILGLALSVLLSSQVGLVTSSARAGHLSLATHLLRCRVNETELELLKNGLPFTETTEEGPCCGEMGDPGYRCSWKVQPVELPTPTELGADGGLGDSGGLGALGALAQLPATGPGALGTSGQGLGGLSTLLAGAAGGGVAGMAPLVMSMVYPDLKPMLEASIRRVTATVHWREGKVDRDLSVQYFVTSPMQGGFNPDAARGLEALGDGT